MSQSQQTEFTIKMRDRVYHKHKDQNSLKDIFCITPSLETVISIETQSSLATRSLRLLRLSPSPLPNPLILLPLLLKHPIKKS
jgi:hypothetical protein